MPHEPVPERLRENARRMRRELTDPERRLWHRLRAHRLAGLGFKRQMPIGRFIADFACPTHRLIVELDGSQHGLDAIVASDQQRTAALERSDWLVLRFWNHEIMNSLDDVCQTIIGKAEGRESARHV